MFDIEDIGDSGDVRDDSKFKKGKVTNRKFQRKSTNQKLGILIHFAFKRKWKPWILKNFKNLLLFFFESKKVNYGSLEAESVFNRGQTIYMRTWGCTHNTSDSEYMAGQLAEAGFKVRVSHMVNNPRIRL